MLIFYIIDYVQFFFLIYKRGFLYLNEGIAETWELGAKGIFRNLRYNITRTG
jgi:hypothetical protein